MNLTIIIFEMTILLRITQNRRYDDSNDIQSDDSDDEYETEECHIWRTKCPATIQFLERSEVP